MGEVKRISLVKFKDDVSEEEREEVHQKYLKLPAAISEIKSMEWGYTGSALYKGFEELGFTHAYIITFWGPQDPDIYFVHPAHQEFAKESMPLIDRFLRLEFFPNMVSPSN